MQSISNSRPQFPPSISAHPFFSGLPLLLRNPLVGRNVERCAAHVPEHHKACHSCGQNTQWFPNSYTSIFKTRWTTSDSNDVFGSRIGSKMPKQHSNESKVPLLFCLWLWVAWASCLHHLMVALEPQSIAPIYRGNTWSLSHLDHCFSFFFSHLPVLFSSLFFPFIDLLLWPPLFQPLFISIPAAKLHPEREGMVTRLQGPKILQ